MAASTSGPASASASISPAALLIEKDGVMIATGVLGCFCGCVAGVGREFVLGAEDGVTCVGSDHDDDDDDDLGGARGDDNSEHDNTTNPDANDEGTADEGIGQKDNDEDSRRDESSS
ncbi:hypothetical protein KCU88_g2880, partial [Aureobasidium melanogenum]